MSELTVFVQEVLFEGRIHLRAAPRRSADTGALPLLERAYHTACLSIAGPPLPFNGEVALAASNLLNHAAWYLLNPLLTIETPEHVLRMPYEPSTPAHHLSADIVLRFLPAVQRHAQAVLANDELPRALTEVLRRWPLSGVLADLHDGPLGPVDFGGHPGLLMLYAERLARHERPGWFPEGPGAAYVELVWQELGRDTSLLPHLHGLARELTNQERKDSA
jgi:hypothetical protein